MRTAPLNQLTVQNEKQYISSQMVQAIESLFEQHGNRSLLDATLKKTTQVYI